MKPRPRLRKTVKWGGAVVAVLLLVVWIASARWGVALMGQNRRFDAIAGGLLWAGQAAPGSPVSRPGTHFFRHDMGFLWWFQWDRSPTESVFGAPLWMLAGSMLIATAAAWRLDALARRRDRIGHCPTCGYNRRGIDAAVPCPECGAMAA